MKKTVIILGVFLLLGNASNASNFNLKNDNQFEFSVYEKSPFHLAVSKGDVEAVKKFIMYGTNVNKMSNNMTPLMLAARFNYCEILQLLIAHGADLEIENSQGFTALRYAEYAKSAESVAILKKKTRR